VSVPKALTAEDFVGCDLKEGGDFTLLIIHTGLVGIASRPNEYHDDEARAFLAEIMRVAAEFSEIEVALLDSVAHPRPAQLLSACVHGSGECEALVFLGSSYARHRATAGCGDAGEDLRTWLLGLLLGEGPRQASSLDEALLWMAFNLAEPPTVDFDEARWDEPSIRDRAIAAVTSSMNALRRDWYPWLFDEDESRPDDAEG
jgi:hypothetical protein